MKLPGLHMGGLFGMPQHRRDLLRDLFRNYRHTASSQLCTRSMGSFGNIPRR